MLPTRGWTRVEGWMTNTGRHPCCYCNPASHFAYFPVFGAFWGSIWCQAAPLRDPVHHSPPRLGPSMKQRQLYRWKRGGKRWNLALHTPFDPFPRFHSCADRGRWTRSGARGRSGYRRESWVLGQVGSGAVEDPRRCGASGSFGEMSLRIKVVVDKFVKELKEALDADIQDRIMKEREMQSYLEEREREVAEREAAWKAELSRREAEVARQEAKLKIEKEILEKEKSVLMGTASNQDYQDGALEITVNGEKYRCLRFAKAKK